MNKAEDFHYNTLLLDFYGGLLSDRRRAVFSAFYLEDLSLTEIAEEYSVTRQAINNSLRETKKELAFYEEKLRLVEKRKEDEEKIEEAKRKMLDIFNSLLDAGE